MPAFGFAARLEEVPMFQRILAVTALASALAISASGLRAEEAHVTEVKEFVTSKVAPWLADPVIVDAIKAQNKKHEGLSEADIGKLDKDWRAQVDASSKPLVDTVLSNAVSKFLTKKKEESSGLITEIFVMDNKGLNVGQSDITSDYWQGDEAKWQKTFKVGPDAVFVDAVEKDESTQQLQVQVSVAIKDPASGAVIGAITLGINVDMLSS
jgi:hypothetical protein